MSDYVYVIQECFSYGFHSQGNAIIQHHTLSALILDSKVTYGHCDCLNLQRFYVASSRQLQRIRAGLHSPVFAHFEESLNGVTSIRAYAQQERFTDRIDDLVDNLNESHYAVLMAER